MAAVVVPFNARYESFCPKCNSLHTKWWPSLREGHCEDCGFDWKMPEDGPAIGSLKIGGNE